MRENVQGKVILTFHLNVKFQMFASQVSMIIVYDGERDNLENELKS